MSYQQEDQIYDLKAEIVKLRAENAELKMPISPDELLPMALMNARLIDENNELKSHNEYLQGDAGLADMVIEKMKADNAQLRKLSIDLSDALEGYAGPQGPDNLVDLYSWQLIHRARKP